MTKDEITLKIQEILTGEFEIDEASVVPDAKLYEDLELDSIDAVDLLVKMKEHIQGKIESDQFKKAKTIQDVVDLIYLLVQKP